RQAVTRRWSGGGRVVGCAYAELRIRNENLSALDFETNASSARHTGFERGPTCAGTVLNSKAASVPPKNAFLILIIFKSTFTRLYAKREKKKPPNSKRLE